LRRHRRLFGSFLLAGALTLAGAIAAPTVASAHDTGGQAPANQETLAELRQCESGSNYAANDGDGYYGAYQFSLGTWQGLGYGGYPHEAPPEIQDEAAYRLWQQQGWDPWPYCADQLGYR